MPFADYRCSVTDQMDVGAVLLEFTVEGTVYTGESAVRLHDGGGCPRYADDFEMEKVTCDKATGDNWQFCREDRPKWFETLDRIIENHLSNHRDYERECLEKILLEES